MNSISMRIYTDFKAPAAYLALGPTLALADECSLAVEWKAFKTAQPPVPAKIESEDKGQRHRRVRAQARRKMHQHYASIQGITMNFRAQAGETDLALCVLETLAPEDRTAFVRACFEAYWVEGADLQSANTLDALLSGTDVNKPFPSLEDCAEKVGNLTESAQVNDGVVDVPGFIVADQVFVGREHFPWIRELCQA